MNKITMLIMSCLLMHQIGLTQIPANDPHWQLKWQDDFNMFNSVIWVKADSAAREDRKNPKNSEPQLYLGNQVWTSNGNLVIEVNNTPIKCPTPAPYPHWVCGECISGKTYNYRSGWIQTNHLYDTRYGYIEARIKLPYKKGFWPAFCTFVGDSEPNSSNVAEIDIFEMYGSNPDNLVETNIHTCYKGDGPLPHTHPNCNENHLVKHSLSNFTYTDWHTYAIEWDKNRITWYIDGKVIRTLSNHKIVDPVRIILNMAIQKESKHHPPTSPAFKEYMYVDYVKVYGLKCDRNTVVNEIPNFNTYDYAVKKSITMSNATTIPANSNITLRTTDGIVLKPGFYAPAGTRLYLDVSPCENAKATVAKNRPTFRDSTIIAGYISEEVVNAQFFVYDATGVLVRNNNVTERGTISIQLHANEFSSAGAYTYFLTADGDTSDIIQMDLIDDNNITVYQNYPNPFDNTTTIECYVPHTTQQATLQVYNMCGSLIKNIVVSERGTVSIEVNAEEFPLTGMYTYLLIGDGQTINTKQMILTKLENRY
ncbi:MAG: family 16 glycosylhydrolase [Bacteroidales bacterium]|nr:family 16 glycosylhydrolase [Bacteroidales bacterium]